MEPLSFMHQGLIEKGGGYSVQTINTWGWG